MKIGFLVLAFSFIFLAGDRHLVAQNSPYEPFIAASDSSGEDTISILQGIRLDSVKQGERLFVVSRPGTGETNRIGFVRLAAAKSFTLQTIGFPAETSIFTVGESVAGEGRIEFYLGSQLKLVTLAKRNKIPNLTCCQDYFPPAKNKPRKRNPNKQ
jgi:hypothetical protein